MKYNAPYGVSDPNAPYLNGNPSTGTMGSIPPAASIEFPQREIVNVIGAAGVGLTPDNANLAQLLQALKLIDVFNVLKIAVNTGTATAWIANVPPLVDPLKGGVCLWFKPAQAAQGPATLAFNGFTAPVVRTDGSQIIPGLFNNTTWLLLFFDGTNWQLIAGAGAPGVLPALQAPQDFYVNGATGSDTLYDGTSATVVAGTSKGPFATIQKALNQVPLYNINGYSITIHVANGTFAMCRLPPVNGAGVVYLTGNIASPASVLVNGVNGSAIMAMGYPGSWIIQGFSVSASGSAVGDPIAGICATGGGNSITLGNTVFRACQAGIYMSNGGFCSNIAGCTWTIQGSMSNFMAVATAGSQFITNPAGSANLTISNPVSITYFANAASLGLLSMLFATITGAGNVTGTKFYVSYNALIYVFANGINYLPGSIAGVQTAGGQYG